MLLLSSEYLNVYRIKTSCYYNNHNISWPCFSIVICLLPLSLSDLRCEMCSTLLAFISPLMLEIFEDLKGRAGCILTVLEHGPQLSLSLNPTRKSSCLRRNSRSVYTGRLNPSLEKPFCVDGTSFLVKWSSSKRMSVSKC